MKLASRIPSNIYLFQLGVPMKEARELRVAELGVDGREGNIKSTWTWKNIYKLK